MKLQAFDSSYFCGKTFFGDDGFQNVLVYQPRFNTLEIKKDKKTEYVIVGKCKGLLKSRQLLLVVEQNNYTTKTVNVYIFCDLDIRPKIPLRKFTLKKLLLSGTNIRKDSDKSKYKNRGYGIAFDGLCSWSFGSSFARDFVIFGGDNGSSSSRTDVRKII